MSYMPDFHPDYDVRCPYCGHPYMSGGVPIACCGEYGHTIPYADEDQEAARDIERERELAIDRWEAQQQAERAREEIA